jgi:hypothetical protein
VLKVLADVYGILGKTEAMEALVKRALQIQVKHLGKHHSDVAHTMVSLANTHGETDPDRKAKILQQALAQQKFSLGANHPEVATTLTNLANCYASTNQLDLARAIFEEAARVKETYWGAGHVEYAKTAVGLGNVCVHSGVRNPFPAPFTAPPPLRAQNAATP